MSTAAAVEGAVPAKAGKKKLVLVLALVLLLLAAGGGGLVFWLKAKAHAAQTAEEDDGAAEPTGKSASKRDPKVVPVFAALDSFTVNLADREADRYAQVGISLELADTKAGERIKVFMPAIRNNILMVLSHKTSAQILSNEGKLVLAGEIQRATSRALGYEVEEPVPVDVDKDANVPRKTKSRKPQPALPVVAVHFSNFIVQ